VEPCHLHRATTIAATDVARHDKATFGSSGCQGHGYVVRDISRNTAAWVRRVKWATVACAGKAIVCPTRAVPILAPVPAEPYAGMSGALASPILFREPDRAARPSPRTLAVEPIA
jgi:hypothetical protein